MDLAPGRTFEELGDALESAARDDWASQENAHEDRVAPFRAMQQKFFPTARNPEIAAQLLRGTTFQMPDSRFWQSAKHFGTFRPNRGFSILCSLVKPHVALTESGEFIIYDDLSVMHVASSLVPRKHVGTP